VLVRAIAVGLGVFKPHEPPQAKEDAMTALRAMFPGGRI
jgi:hypothetical protein